LFYQSPGEFTGKNALSLSDFGKMLRFIEVQSIDFHFSRGDFRRWIQLIIGDVDLAIRINRIPQDARGEKLRNDLIRVVNERLSELKKSRHTYTSVHPIPMEGPLPRTVSDGFLAVGDAASQVKPTTGGGVIFGLTCAQIAGEVACKAVDVQNFSETLLSSYQSLWKRMVGFELNTMLRMRKMLDSLSDRRLDNVIGLCSRLGVDNVLEKAGDLDFQGRSLISVAKYPGTAAVISYFIFSWLTSATRQ